MKSPLFLTLGAALLVLAAADFNLLEGWVDAISNPSQELEKWKRPEFCGNSECPEFRVEKTYDDYEIRTYQKGKWVTTKVNDTKYELAYTKATARLMRYFKSGNDQKASMDLTTPTLAHLKPDKDTESTERSYAFSWWIPEEYQHDTPQPNDDDVKVKCYSKSTVYVRAFGGFATESTILQNTRDLQKILQDDDRDYDNKNVFVAIYDPPQKLLNRHNEIHMSLSRKSSQEVTAAT